MLLTLFKTLLFAGAVLLVGQIPLGKETIGSRFYGEVSGAFRWTGGKVQKVATLAGFGEIGPLSRWAQKSTSAPGSAKRDESSDDGATDSDGLSPSDKEALMRLLQ